MESVLRLFRRKGKAIQEIEALLKRLELEYTQALDAFVYNGTEANRSKERALFLRISELNKKLTKKRKKLYEGSM